MVQIAHDIRTGQHQGARSELITRSISLDTISRAGSILEQEVHWSREFRRAKNTELSMGGLIDTCVLELELELE